MLPTICGTAVATMVVSMAASAMVSIKPTRTAPRRDRAAPRGGAAVGTAEVMRLLGGRRWDGPRAVWPVLRGGSAPGLPPGVPEPVQRAGDHGEHRPWDRQPHR